MLYLGMLKKISSVVLTSLSPLNVLTNVRLGASLVAALLEDLFEHPDIESFHFGILRSYPVPIAISCHVASSKDRVGDLLRP